MSLLQTADARTHPQSSSERGGSGFRCKLHRARAGNCFQMFGLTHSNCGDRQTNRQAAQDMTNEERPVNKCTFILKQMRLESCWLILMLIVFLQ